MHLKMEDEVTSHGILAVLQQETDFPSEAPDRTQSC